MAKRIGFIGLGNMGLPMATNIARGGLPLWAWNRTPGKGKSLARVANATLVGSLAELGEQTDAIITVVADGAALEDVYFGDGDLVEALRPGAICVDMSTVAPWESVDISQRLAEHGFSFMDAPISGSVAHAASGELTIMAGGDPAHLEQIRPVFDLLGQRLFHMGPVGTGSTMKLVINSIVYGLNQALAEALVLAERTGIGRAAAYEVIASSAVAAPFVDYRKQAFLRPGEVPAAFRMELARKDLDLILSLAADSATRMPQTETNRDVIQDGIRAGLAEKDISATAEYLRSISASSEHRSTMTGRSTPPDPT